MMLGLPFSLWNYSPPFGFIIMVLYCINISSLGFFLRGLSMNSDRKYYVKIVYMICCNFEKILYNS